MSASGLYLSPLAQFNAWFSQNTIGNNITDFGTPNEEAAGTGMDETLGVSVVFDEASDEDENDGVMGEVREEDDEDEDFGVDVHEVWRRAIFSSCVGGGTKSVLWADIHLCRDMP